MDDYRRRATLRTCEHFRRGIFTADEACGVFLSGCFEPGLAVQYVELLPRELQAALAAFLPTLPDSDEGWAAFQGVGQLDGDEWSWARMVLPYRANTEAVRWHMLRQASAPVAVDFVDRIRVAYHKMVNDFRRSVDVRRQKQAEPAAAPDSAV